MNYGHNYNYDCYDPNYGYYMQLVKRLAEYIQDELQDSEYYKELAKMAPTDLSKEIINEFSEDEMNHAKNFQQVYYMLTGRYYVPEPVEPIVIDDYEEALKIRVLAETNDYEKYGEEYLMAPNKYLRDLFFMTRTKEAMHAMRISILFEEE